ncbi:MAG: VWA domain-containing protein [Phycisphaerales bacterium]|nr:VWA domain-containing protein [Phycisphaerales bacterium]
MPFHIEQPLWLLSALAAIPMAGIALTHFAGMSRLRRVMSGITRIALIALIAAILAGIASVRETDRLAVIAVVDVSTSVQRVPAEGVGSGVGAAGSNVSTLQAIRTQLLRATAQRGQDDLLGIVAFDGRPVLVASPTTPLSTGGAEIADRPLEYKVQEGTNIADALSLAATLIPSDATGRLLLITDGVQTSGDALAAARRIAASDTALGPSQGVPIDVVPIRYRLRPEVIVESVDAPPMSPVGAPVTVRAVLRSTDPASGTVMLFDNDSAVDINGDEPGLSRRVKLEAGPNLFVAEIPVGVSRVHRFKIEFEPDIAASAAEAGDRLVDNNSGEAFTITPSVGSVLLVDGVTEFGESQTPSPLAASLRDADINVTVVSAGAMPSDLLALQNYDLVILENVPADAVSTAAQQALATHVKDMAAGLVMIGGPMSFGAGGWKGSVIEPILPVKLELPDTLVEPEAAIIFVLDNSGSMNRSVMGSSRSQQEIANEAAARAVMTLSRADLVGVIEFNSQAEVIVPLALNTAPTQTAQKIRDITAGGGTNAGPGLEEARKQMSGVKAKAKHVILLSDGRSQRAESLPQMATVMKAEGITVSTISVGDGADLATMKAVAQNGGGEPHEVTNPNVLPRIFLKAIRVIRTPLYREELFDPVVTDASPGPLRGLGKPPELGGLNLTQPRPEPTIINAITSPKGEPVLSIWRAELGQVAAFTSDAGEWARGWVGWRGYQQFWAQMVRSLSRPTQDRLFRPRLEARGADLVIRLEAMEEDGKALDALEVPASVYTPSGQEVTVILKQSGSGIYEGVVPATETGTHVTVLRPTSGSRKFAPVIAGTSVRAGLESQRLESDAALVESIARQSGGRVFELANLGAGKLFDRAGIQPRRTLLPLVDLLLPWALAALLLDIGMRRIAWDRLIPERAPVRAREFKSLAERLGHIPAASGPQSGESPSAFTDRDAAELAMAQRDRRIAERLAAARAASASSPVGNSPVATAEQPPSTAAPEAAQDEPESQSGLAAAKRRALRRFKEDA